MRLLCITELFPPESLVWLSHDDYSSNTERRLNGEVGIGLWTPFLITVMLMPFKAPGRLSTLKSNKPSNRLCVVRQVIGKRLLERPVSKSALSSRFARCGKST